MLAKRKRATVRNRRVGVGVLLAGAAAAALALTVVAGDSEAIDSAADTSDALALTPVPQVDQRLDPPGVASFAEFDLFSVGTRFEDLPLVAVERQKQEAETRLPVPEPFGLNIVNFIYGTCEPVGADGGQCAPPLAVQVWPACVRAVADYADGFGPMKLFAIGAARAAVFADQRVEVYTGEVTVVVFAWTEARAMRAAAKLVGANTSAGIGKAPGAPSPRAMSGQLQCD